MARAAHRLSFGLFCSHAERYALSGSRSTALSRTAIAGALDASLEWNAMKHAWKPIAAALIAMMTIAACTSSSRTTESTGEYVDDAVITSKVKAALVGDSGLKSYEIGVETFKDTVQLSGFVNSAQVKARAGEVAAGVSGVKSVRNNLVVK